MLFKATIQKEKDFGLYAAKTPVKLNFSEPEHRPRVCSFFQENFSLNIFRSFMVKKKYIYIYIYIYIQLRII